MILPYPLIRCLNVAVEATSPPAAGQQRPTNTARLLVRRVFKRLLRGSVKKQLGVLLALNLVTRSVWVAVLHPTPQSDFGFYFDAAARMAAGGGYTMNGQPTAYWPIGWPGVLSILFRVFGAHLWVGLVLQVLLCTGIALLVFLIAHHISGSVMAGMIGGLAWTFLPDQLAWTSILGSEPLFTLLTLCGLYALLFFDGWRRPVIAGALLGAACWVRPTLLFLPVVVVVVLIVQRRRVVAPLAEGALLMLMMLALIAPLTVRNYVVLGSPVLVSTNGGIPLWQGVHVDDSYWWPSDATVNPLAAISDEVARDQLGQRLFLEHLVAHPTTVAVHALRKIAALYSSPSTVWWWLTAGQPLELGTLVDGVSAIAYWLFMAVALIGLAIGWQRWRGSTMLLGGFLAYYTAVFAFFPANDRYRYPMMPVFAIFVGIALFSITKAIQARWARQRTDPRRVAD